MKTKITRRGRPPRLAVAGPIPTVKPSLVPLEPPSNQAAVMCHYCGYEPPMSRVPPDGRCPKCRGCSWERFIIPRRIFPLNG